MKIGILGKMASGKSTLAHKIMALDSRFVTLSFAGKIKVLAQELFNMQAKDRMLLQSIGTKMREIKSSVWIDYLLAQADKETHVVVDDVRYKDEIEALQAAGFIIVYLEVDSDVQRQRLISCYGKDVDSHLLGQNHESEQANKFTLLAHIIAHPKSLTELDKLAQTLVKGVRKASTIRQI